MGIFDAHVHTSFGQEGLAGQFLNQMDAAGFEGAVVLSPMIDIKERYPSPRRQIEGIDLVTKFVSEAPDRLIPFATIAPQVGGAPEAVRYAAERGCVGIKMLPNHWYPYDEKLLFPVYRVAEELGLPILFHSGILWGFGDSSRFCQPVYYEALLHFPRIRFALAHIAWPWTDECIAVWGRMNHAKLRGKGPDMYIDTTPGTPDFYRKEAMRRAFAYCSADWIFFGTDCTAKSDASEMKRWADFDRELLNEIGVAPEDQDKYFRTNLLKFVGKA